MASQPDSTPWTSPALTPSSSTTHLRGRGYFSELGLVRTKPGRADSPQVSSKSCSDKLAARQALSLLLTPTALLVAPGNAYIHTIVLPASQYSAAACVRAFGEAGRLAGLRGRAWSDGGYAFRPFLVETTEVEFAFSRRAGGKLSSNLAVAMVRGWGCEALIGGVLQGRKQFAGPAAGSGVCKARLWERTAEMAPAARVQRYGELKEMAWERGVVKEEVRRVLGGWFRCGGDDFELPAGDGL